MRHTGKPILGLVLVLCKYVFISSGCEEWPVAANEQRYDVKLGYNMVGR